MKRFSLLLGVVAVLAFVAAGSVFAADAGGKAPGGKGGKGGGMTMGEITKIVDKNITIKSSREGAPDVTGAVDDATEIFIEVPTKVGALKVGDRVRIQVGDKRAYGEITKIDGNAITVKGRTAEETITVDDTAVIMVMAKAEFKDLKVGQQVMASVREGKLARITVRAPEKK